MMTVPWLLHDAELALWPAWKDGMPMRGPGAGRGLPSPLFACKSSLSITETMDKSSDPAWNGAPFSRASSYQIRITFPDGSLADSFGRLVSRIHPGGYRVLTVRFYDEPTGHWTLLSFYYVTPESDEVSESGQVLSRTVMLRAGAMQERVGVASLPSLQPVVLGEVEWVCGSVRVPCYHFDPVEETWTSLATNETGDGTRYVNFSPVLDVETDVALSAYVPRAVSGSQPPPALPRADVLWQNQVLLRLGNHASGMHHGLMLLHGLALQAIGIAEPLVKASQDRMLDEPVIVFRFLRRVYATLGHGVFAVPALRTNEDPPFTHDFAFRLAVPGAVNPSTGQSGLVLLPDGAWLDGTVATIE